MAALSALVQKFGNVLGNPLLTERSPRKTTPHLRNDLLSNQKFGNGSGNRVAPVRAATVRERSRNSLISKLIISGAAQPTRRRRGQVTVEFVMLFMGVLIPATFSIIFTSQLLWVWHSVNDFTRQGAGYAATHCWQSSADNVVQFMKSNVPLMFAQEQFQSGAAQIQVSYFSVDPVTGALTPFACDGDCSTNCIPDRVTVSISGLQFGGFVTALGLPPITLPNFQTSLPIESAGCDPEQGVCLP